jgi:hypothetical protein
MLSLRIAVLTTKTRMGSVSDNHRSDVISPRQQGRRSVTGPGRREAVADAFIVALVSPPDPDQASFAGSVGGPPISFLRQYISVLRQYIEQQDSPARPAHVPTIW